ncbi:hypothetical protein CLCR_00257 [Cladophialophora carrionii]|uniref:Uncharacterized protein n=1 Tax=Cladophialophora carrionii TaxID=86049 RepID=A0A1C1D064_9EURO|nr:hypothetical protein CLCR_00257 [Cladophialophora carrionii]
MAVTDSKAVAVQAGGISHLLYEAQPHSHILGGQARFQELFREFSFGEEKSVHRLTVQRGIPYREDVECAKLVERNHASSHEPSLTVFFTRCLPRKQIALTPAAFAQLLENSHVPPSYLEVLSNNNGIFSSYVLRGHTGLATHYYLMVKFPFGPFSNGSLFTCHSLATGHTTCIISATQAQILVDRLFDVFSHSPLSYSPSSPYAFIPAALLLEHMRIANEDDRGDIDQSVCRIENRSGVSLHNFGSRTRAKIGEYALLQRELHMQDALIVMADHCFSFHAKCAAFIVTEEQAFAALLSARPENDRVPTPQEQADHVRASLTFNASMSTWTLEQLRGLEKRLKVQLRVIDSTISATDALTMIRLARASRSDSNTMKAITILTMVFLPATFVCSLFSMGFFDFTDDDEDDPNLEGRQRTMRVAGSFWIYFAVAVPLTVLVLGLCAAWLHWSGRQEDDSGDKPRAWRQRKGDGKE